MAKSAAPLKKQNDPLCYAGNLAAAGAAVYLVTSLVLRVVAEWFVRVFHASATLQNPVSVPESVVALLNLLLAAGGLLAAFAFIEKNAAAQMRPVIILLPPRDKRLWLFLPVFLGLGILTNMGTSLLQKTLVKHTAYQVPMAPMLPKSGFALVLTFLAMCVIPAILEELLCRGAMQGVFRRWGVWFSIVVSSTIFTLLHGDIAQMPGIFILSLFLGLTAYATDSLLPGMVLHFANNIVAFGFLIVNQKMDGMTALGFSLYLMAILGVGAAVCIGVIHKEKLLKTLRPIPRVYDAKNRQSRVTRLAKAPIFLGVLLFLSVYAVLALFWKG
ncbi:MAG: CPBP family intramembrane glutamic endopeptidase [Ruthenibacterium sp.]